MAAAAAPSVAFRENQFELRSGNLLFQSQFYTTTVIQTLFHSQSAAGSDAEAFSFAPMPGGGIAIAQTSSSDLAATDTGFFTAAFSFLKFTCPTGEGYMHTSINDPICTKTLLGTGIMFPQMVKMSKTGPAANESTKNMTASANKGQNLTAPENVTQNATFPITGGQNMTVPTIESSNLTAPGQLVKKALSSQVGVTDNTNVLGPARPTPRATTALSANNTTRPGNADSLLSKPLSKQANKPFTQVMTPLVNPRKACRADVTEMSAWERFNANVLGRIGVDSTYAGYTSAPTYINPYNIVKLADQFQVSSDSMNMTRPDSYLQQRLWCL